MTGYLWLAALIGGGIGLAPIVVGELGLLIHKIRNNRKGQEQWETSESR